MAQVRFEQVSKSFGNVIAVNDVDLLVEEGEFVTLVGPSGSGKTTTLNMLAGLEMPTSGRIYIDDRDITYMPPGQRNVSMVFQNYALYPHMKVWQNIGFPLRVRNIPKKEIQTKVLEAATILGIEELMDRFPKELSGGQRQRVALGRAIVRHPDVFLLDEPLSNLDAILRVQTRAELRGLFDRLKATVLYVTHDQIEAMTLSDRMIVFKDGRIQQIGKPLEVYQAPENQFVAKFIGSPPMCFFPAMLDHENGFDIIRAGELKQPYRAIRKVAAGLGSQVVVGVRSEDWILEPETSEKGLRCQVQIIEQMGSVSLVYVTADPIQAVVTVAPDSQYRRGDQLKLLFRENAVHLFDPQSGNTLMPN